MISIDTLRKVTTAAKEGRHVIANVLVSASAHQPSTLLTRIDDAIDEAEHAIVAEEQQKPELIPTFDSGTEAFYHINPQWKRNVGYIIAELQGANQKHKGFRSAHEGYAVILEELEELWDEIKANRGTSENARQEAIQVAAMALKYLLFHDDATAQS